MEASPQPSRTPRVSDIPHTPSWWWWLCGIALIALLSTPDYHRGSWGAAAHAPPASGALLLGSHPPPRPPTRNLHLAPLSRICTLCRDLQRRPSNGTNLVTLRGVDWQQLRLRAAAVAVRASGGPSTFPGRIVLSPWAQEGSPRSARSLAAHGLLLSPAFLFDARFSVRVPASLLCEAARLSLRYMGEVAAARKAAVGAAPTAGPASRNVLDGAKGFYGIPVSGGVTAGWVQLVAPIKFVERNAAANEPGVAMLSIQDVPNATPSHFWQAALSKHPSALARFTSQAKPVPTTAWLSVREAARRLEGLLGQLAASSFDVTLPDLSHVRLPASPSPSVRPTAPAWNLGSGIKKPSMGKAGESATEHDTEEYKRADERMPPAATGDRRLQASVPREAGARLRENVRFPTTWGAFKALFAERSSAMAAELFLQDAESASGSYLTAFDTVVTRCGFLLTPPTPPHAPNATHNHRRSTGANMTYHTNARFLDLCLSGIEAGLSPADGAWVASLPLHDEMVVMSYYLESQIYHWTADSLAALAPILLYLRSYPHVKLHVLDPDFTSRAHFRREQLSLLFGSDAWQQRIVSGDVRARIAHVPDRHVKASPHIIWTLLLRERLRSALGHIHTHIRAYPQFIPGELRDPSQLDAPRPPPERLVPLQGGTAVAGGRALGPASAAARPGREPFNIVYARRNESRVLSVDDELLCRLRALQAWSHRDQRRRPVSVVDVWERELPSELEQLRIFSAADVVIAAHGAGITHMIVTRAGACLVEVLPSTFASAVYMRQSVALGFRYVPLVGEGCKDCPLVQVDMGAVLGAVASCLPAELLAAGAPVSLVQNLLSCGPSKH